MPKEQMDDIVRGIAARSLWIALVALFCGGALFALSWFGAPRTEVTGYAEIGRIFHITHDGDFKEILVNPAVLVAGQINSGAFSPPDAKTRVVARLMTRTENLELKAQAASREEGVAAIQAIMERVAADHRARQAPELDRMRKRQEMLDSEAGRVRSARNKFDAGIEALSKAGVDKPGLNYLVLTALRVQVDKDLRQLELERQSVADTIEMIREHPTRLLGEPTVSRASLLPSLLLALFGVIVGGLAASLVAGFAAYRALRKAA